MQELPAAPTLQVFAYIKILPPLKEDDGEGARVAAIPIFSGPWNRENVTRLLRTIHNVLALPLDKYGLVDDSHLLPFSRTRENVIILDNIVFKLYDYRGRAEGERRAELNIRFIAGCVTVIQQSDLTLIKYPLVEGDHVAQFSTDFIGVLRHLNQVHEENYVHMDIKAANMVFNHNDGTKSQLIDFDYSGFEDVVTYPSRYNPSIEDGERHRDATRHQRGFKSHDLFSLAHVMLLFQPSDNTKITQWTEWTKRVQETGQLMAVADELEQIGSFPLQLVEEIETGPTGSPPEMKGSLKRKKQTGGGGEEEAEFNL
eukprot:gene23626-29865_t